MSSQDIWPGCDCPIQLISYHLKNPPNTCMLLRECVQKIWNFHNLKFWPTPVFYGKTHRNIFLFEYFNVLDSFGDRKKYIESLLLLPLETGVRKFHYFFCLPPMARVIESYKASDKEKLQLRWMIFWPRNNQWNISLIF